MNSIELLARAKINLSLDVTGKRPDGYHEVRMLMQTIELSDRVYMQKTVSGITIETNCKWLPTGPSNIAYKAAAALMDACRIQSGIRIYIEKNIPVAAGLAGGSTDAAAVLQGLNEMLELDIEEKDLLKIGKRIGADVPFCIKGGTMLAEGIGEVLTGLTPLREIDLLLVKPKVSVSTEWVYKNLVLDKICDRPDTDRLIECINNGKLGELALGMKNVLETVTIPKHPVIGEIKDKLLRLGAMGSLMSGSGPSVFGMFESGEAARKAASGMSDDRWECFLTKTILGGSNNGRKVVQG